MSQSEAKVTVAIKKRIMDKGLDEFITAIQQRDLDTVKKLLPLYRWTFTGEFPSILRHPLLEAIAGTKDFCVLQYLLKECVDPDHVGSRVQNPLYPC